jgi:protoporphyrinogen oxidase
LDPQPPISNEPAARQIDYRAMILVYLVLGQQQFTEYDAHYFPGEDIPITRLSEPKNYSASPEPRDRTVLCAELPCSPQDTYWSMPDSQLGQVVQDALRRVEIPIQAPILQIEIRRLRNAYPIYLKGYEAHFKQLDEQINQVDRVLTFGRQGLFAHDNTHHALFMAYRAVDCLDQEGRFDRERWAGYRKIFETHVVED